MIFAHDTEVALAAAAVLVNTGRGRTEQLPDTAALDRFTAAGVDQGGGGGQCHFGVMSKNHFDSFHTCG